MKHLLFSLCLIFSIGMMGNTSDSTKVPDNRYLVKAGTIGKTQMTIVGITLVLTNYFRDNQYYNEVKVFSGASALVLIVLEWKKNTYLQKAGGHFVE
jgi:hypothetical protein